jgi:hypothetical protein
MVDALSAGKSTIDVATSYSLICLVALLCLAESTHVPQSAIHAYTTLWCVIYTYIPAAQQVIPNETSAGSPRNHAGGVK